MFRRTDIGAVIATICRRLDGFPLELRAATSLGYCAIMAVLRKRNRRSSSRSMP
jgi:hypothetical protein